MKASDLRELSEQEIDLKEEELKETVFRFRLRRGANQLESPAALRTARRDLARVKTIKVQRAKASHDNAG